jgi:glycosyltransferase involved in cell wall biosynthesis
MARTVEAGFPVVLSKVHIAPMGADLGVTFTPAGMLREPARVLFVGRLAEKKGLEVLLRAFSLVRRSCPYSTLQVIGSGPQAADLMALATNLGLEGHVSWQGSRTHQEIVQALRSAACLVFPSVVAKDGDQEGLGLVPIEALGCECPVIASDLPAVRDVIRDHETGLLVTPGSVEQLASAIELVLGDTVLATNLAKRGRDDVLKRFDWEVVGNNYKTIIHGLSDG